MLYVLDAHPLIWFFESNPRLSNTCRPRLSDPSSLFSLPANALAEVTPRTTSLLDRS